MTHVAAGFALGFAGSVHCLAMCGPLVSVVAPAIGRHAAAAIWYQAGRLSIYAIVGAAAGFAGHVVITAGLSRWLAIAAGVTLVTVALGLVRIPRLTAHVGITSLLSRAIGRIARVRARHPRVAAAGAGAVNGLLPCGLVYAAAIAAIATGSVTASIQLMLAFGLGTVPAMTVVWFSSSLAPAGVRRRLKFAAPVAIAIVGLLLIGRGVMVTGHHH